MGCVCQDIQTLMLLADAPVMNAVCHKDMTAKRQNPKQDLTLALALATLALLLTVALRQMGPDVPSYAVQCMQTTGCPVFKHE